MSFDDYHVHLAIAAEMHGEELKTIRDGVAAGVAMAFGGNDAKGGEK